MSIREISRRLAEAGTRFEAATSALRETYWRPDRQDEYWAAHRDLLESERALAAAQGAEYAVPLEFPVQWDAGAPRPHLLCDDYRALLAFVLREQHAGGEGSSAEIAGPGAEKRRRLALVEFIPCTAARLGAPNDEVFHGHPLHGRGQDGYTAQQVMNSRWLAELEAINRVHHCYDPAHWRDRNHYVFWFHDTTFECIAKGFTVEVHQESRAEMLDRMCRRLRS